MRRVGELVQPTEALEPGTVAGSFVLEDKIGRGGFGAVYLARHVEDGHRAAVKVLHDHLALEPAAVERFLREVKTITKIAHEAIVEVYEVGRLVDGRPYFAMEYFEGIDLGRILHSDGRLTPVDTYQIMAQIGGALETAHAAGIIHRDIKAENVLLSRDRAAKLVDFGVAKLLDPDPGMPGLTTTQQVFGTLVAMAPEQLRMQPIDQRTDIYGLGVLLYHMLTGVLPFCGSAQEVVQMHVDTPPRPPSTHVPLSPALDAVVLRCLEKAQSARYPSVTALLADLRVAVFGDQAPTRPCNGLGVLVRAMPGDELDDDALADAALALESAESMLREAGFQVAVQTSSEVFGVKATPSASDEALAARARTIDLAQRLHDTLCASLGGGVRVGVTVSCDAIHVREATGEIVGGPLLEIGAWSWPHDGVVVTPRASAGLSRP